MEQENGTSETPFIDEDGELEPREAAELLARTKSRAQRQFDTWPPYLLFIGAAIFLLAYGAVWLSVRGQHPYVGPSGGALAIMYGVILVWIISVVTVLQRANSGISGRSKRERGYRAGYLVIIFAYSAYQGALYHAGASHAIVYGVYPASILWLLAGTAFITMGAIREEWPTLTLGGTLVAIGVGAAFAGPVIGWLVSGVGLCVVLAGFGVMRTFMRRA
ncbi:MAG: hypothetical protein WAK12_02710 [Acidimicrobiales bacterium]